MQNLMSKDSLHVRLDNASDSLALGAEYDDFIANLGFLLDEQEDVTTGVELSPIARESAVCLQTHDMQERNASSQAFVITEQQRVTIESRLQAFDIEPIRVSFTASNDLCNRGKVLHLSSPQASPLKRPNDFDSQQLSLPNAALQAFGKPSSYLRAALMMKSSPTPTGGRAAKKQKVLVSSEDEKEKEPQASPLHLACLKQNVKPSEIDVLLRLDARAATRPMRTKKNKRSIINPLTLKMETKLCSEMYLYPLNLAIYYQASADVIHMLVRAAPSVLLMRDGPQHETSLTIYLRKTERPLLSIIELMLSKHPKCALTKDRHENCALHIACSRGSAVPLAAVQHIHQLYPHILKKRNFHGKTPVDLFVQRSTNSCEEMSTYLFEHQS